MSDHTYRARGAEGRSGAQIATATIEKVREKNPAVGTIKNLGHAKIHNTEEERMLAYRQFGVYSRAKASAKKPNKHEADAPAQRKLKESND
jgi:hypothetical protein